MPAIGSAAATCRSPSRRRRTGGTAASPRNRHGT